MSPGPPCSVCTHPDRAEIDRAIVGGESLPKISARYREIGEDSLQRHKDGGHIAEKVQRAQRVKELMEADALLQHALLWRQRTNDVYRAAWDALYSPEPPNAQMMSVALKAINTNTRQDAALLTEREKRELEEKLDELLRQTEAEGGKRW